VDRHLWLGELGSMDERRFDFPDELAEGADFFLVNCGIRSVRRGSCCCSLRSYDKSKKPPKLINADSLQQCLDTPEGVIIVSCTHRYRSAVGVIRHMDSP